MLDLPTWITFDCYDTLVEFPIDAVTRQILGERLDPSVADEFFAAFEDRRYQAIFFPYQPYRDVLRHSLAETMQRFGIAYQATDGDALVAAVPSWGPFPDVPPALERLRERCKLAIISNTDDDIIAGNVERIGVPIDKVITAEQAHVYKPSPSIFNFALKELGCTPDELVHVAQGFQYDIIPAHSLGWRRVWINRYGKTGNPLYEPYHELPDLSGLPDLLGA